MDLVTILPTHFVPYIYIIIYGTNQALPVAVVKVGGTLEGWERVAGSGRAAWRGLSFSLEIKVRDTYMKCSCIDIDSIFTNYLYYTI